MAALANSHPFSLTRLSCQHGPVPAPTLVAEATRRSEAVWVAAPGGRPRVLWHLWHDDALWLVGDGDERPLPELRDRAEVTVRSRARPTDRVLTWTADVDRIEPGSTPARRTCPRAGSSTRGCCVSHPH